MNCPGWPLTRIAEPDPAVTGADRAGQADLDRSGLRSPASRTSSSLAACQASRRVRAISSTETPLSAAFSWSVTNTNFSAGASTVSSTSATPGSRRRRSGDRAGRGDQVVIRLIGPAVDLRDQRGEHRRSRRQLHDLEPGAVLARPGGQIVAEPQGNGVTLLARGLLADEVHPQSPPGAASLPQVVVPHQAVEVDRAGHADVADVVGDFGNLRQLGLEIPDQPRWLAPASSLRRGRAPEAARSCCRTAASSAAPSATPPGPSRRPSAAPMTAGTRRPPSREREQRRHQRLEEPVQEGLRGSPRIVDSRRARWPWPAACPRCELLWST